MQSIMNSLRRRILLGYTSIAALMAGLALFSFIELRMLEEKIVSGERVARFFDISLEIRRFEKNYFLYHQAADLVENRAFIDQARELLRAHADIPSAIQLGDQLEHYALLMEGYADNENDALAGEIRKIGKEIVTLAEDLAQAERQALATMLNSHRYWLILSALAVGLLMAIVITSLTRAFNHVIRQLDLRQGQLVRSEKLAALGTLLSGVAHEINNPLSNISSSCEILTEEVGVEGTAFQKELLNQIDTETWRARRIVRSLLDYARDREFHREAVPLAQMIEETLRLIRGQIPASVSIEHHITDNLIVTGDKQRLQQVLFNLIGNAAEALEGAGSIDISARPTRAPCPADTLVFGQCRNSNNVVEIEIRDNGHGIPANILPHIFDPFFTTKAVGCGSGLGLFIVFEIIEEHGGCIAVRSEAGKGTTFYIHLPTMSTGESHHG